MLLYPLVVVVSVIIVLSVTPTRSQNTSTTPPLRVVQTPLGAISGRMLTAKNGRQYEAFRGIPYATPPVGDLRFSKPQPHPPFNQRHFDAGEYGNYCWQTATGLLNLSGSIMSEDCLFLNVFRPSGISQRNLLPVFVFIHGGAFVWGSSDLYNVGGLATSGSIIVVTVNYRLGVFGFLSTGEPTLSGNYGLWDQHLAIQWVRDNIQAFNGDPDKITVGGESAGSAGVAYQTLTPFSRGLFARAILQSGSVTSSWALQRNPLDQAQKFALSLSCPSPRSTTSTGDASFNGDFLSCARRASPEKVLLASHQETTLARAAVDFVFVPTVDGEFVMKNPADMLNDIEYLKQIGFYERDYLSGCVNNEGGSLPSLVQALMVNESLILNPEFYDLDLVPLLIEQKFGNSSAVVEEVVKFFYTYPRYSDSRQLDKKQVLDTAGDAGFYVPLTEFARAVATGRSSARRNLVYLLEHYPTYTPDGYLGLPHGQDLMYEFDIDWFLLNASFWTADDERLREVLMSVIVEFVKSGNPESAFGSSLQDGWTDFNLIDESYLSIKVNSSSIQRHIRPRATSLWLDLLPTLLDPAFGQTNHSTSHVPTLSELIG